MVKKTFVIEGKLENLEAVIQQLIEQNGGVIVSVKNSKYSGLTFMDVKICNVKQLFVKIVLQLRYTIWMEFHMEKVLW